MLANRDVCKIDTLLPSTPDHRTDGPSHCSHSKPDVDLQAAAADAGDADYCHLHAVDEHSVGH